MSVNKPLLRKVYKFLLKHPEKHNQMAWCGTRQCVAGWAVHFDGWRRTADVAPVVMADGWHSEDDTKRYVAKDEMVDHVAIVATSILGLDHEQAWNLFYGTNRESLRLLKELCR